jgi:hypothetical protein
MVNATACHAVDCEFNPRPSRHFRACSSEVDQSSTMMVNDTAKEVGRLMPLVRIQPCSNILWEYSSTVELLTLNQQVQGSNPCVPTNLLGSSSVAVSGGLLNRRSLVRSQPTQPIFS